MKAPRKLLPILIVAASSLAAVPARAEEVIISVAPPAPRHGVVVVSPGHVRVPGYWRWGGRGYLWVGSGWRWAPHPRALWVPGGYRRWHGGWVWRGGHWR